WPVVSKTMRYLASEKQTVIFELDSPFMIVGERINPTGKKKLQEELKGGSFEIVNEFAVAQEAQGASLLDINMGMSGIDEKATMLKAIEEVTMKVSLPLVIDSSHVDVIEQALRRYPGRALINSISFEKVKFEYLMPIAKKYGAMFILLPLSDEGLPKTLEEKKTIIHQILKRADKLAISRNDIIVDGLVATVGANKSAAIETLETIRYCKEELKLPTIVGLSNISFGLPERINVNEGFLTLAIQAGLTMAISNPSQQQLVACALATDMLLNKNNSDIRYIRFINDLKEQYPDMAPMGTISSRGEQGLAAHKKVPDMTAADSKKESTESTGSVDKIYKAVLSGNRKSIVAYTKEAVDSGKEARIVLDESLLPAINEVGVLFEKGKYFLPQLIASAEAMKLAIEYLEPMLMSVGKDRPQVTIVIATVKGDIHDIGKNLVSLMLKNYGFKVIDLGKDVAKEDIIKAAKENQAQIIALSALMTTTMPAMKRVVELAEAEGVKAQIIIGGAVITQEYADEIHADGYSKDAQEAVKLVQKLMKLL
ncbi:MAG TPA: dihydropteroate synthase, partial [Lachnospiraceae bacterium]|nr:dihydropteroate synthase [Lachnospiraceae bacterium]